MRPRAALKFLAQDHRNALANLWAGNRRGPCFFPEQFPVPGTMWRVTTAFDEAANPSNDAPHNPPNRFRSCFSGGMLPMRCSAVATRAHAPSGVSGTALDRE